MSISDKDLKGSEARLWALVEERATTGADVKVIDRRIWDLFGEEWAVMFTDLSGFSRQVAAFGICHFLQIIFEQKKILLPIVADHDGILIKIEADSLLVLFRKPASALAAAVAMQHACQKLSARRVPEEQVLLCVGLGYGTILRIGDTECFGAQVNAASKLGEDTARPNEILVSGEAHDALHGLPGLAFEELDVKIPGTTRSYRVGYESFKP
jgi:adenylate cyclase